MSRHHSQNASAAIRKGSIAGARAGQLPNVTGIDQPDETPAAPEISIDTSVLSAEAACERIVGHLQQRRYV
jgi:bifunctional enzyme CysN/CysC